MAARTPTTRRPRRSRGDGQWLALTALIASLLVVLLPPALGVGSAAAGVASERLPESPGDLVAALREKPVLMAAAAVAGGVCLFCCVVCMPMLCILLRYWQALFFFWTGGLYADAGPKLGLSKYSRAHLYSLASVPWLMTQPHYRTGTFQEDMLTNLRNVVPPTGLLGVPLSVFARSRVHTVLAVLVLLPSVAFVGAWWRKWHGLEDSAAECFGRSLLSPTDWFQLWRLNCRLASMTSLATQSKDFELEDKWVFIQNCLEKKIPVTPVMDWPVTLVAKDCLEEGGMGIHVLKNVLHGGRWILQEKLDNCDAVKSLLPSEAPLSTMRVLTGSHGALADLGVASVARSKAHTLATVWRAGRQGASTDHNCIMVNVPNCKSSDVLGRSSTSAHWYARGWKSFGMPVSTKDGSITAHPDTGLDLEGKRLPGASEAAELCERAHDMLMPGVPLAGWDVAFCPSKTGGAEPELILLEANLSCNFFRGDIDWTSYADLLDEHFLAIDAWRRSRR